MSPKGKDARPRGVRRSVKEEEKQSPTLKRCISAEEGRFNKSSVQILVKR